MANENNKKNELVADDDDPTAELEALTERHSFGASGGSATSESDASTYDVENQAVESETIERLQFDIEQLRARWIGLETEIKAREELTNKLNADLKSGARTLARKEKLLHKRDRTIKSLKAEIRERDAEFRDLQEALEEVRAQNRELETRGNDSGTRQQVDAQSGRIASLEASLRETAAQQERTEEYADELRRQLSDISNRSQSTAGERDSLAAALQAAEEQIRALNSELSVSRETVDKLTRKLGSADAAHAEEIRLLRFELGEAEQTLSQNSHISEQLASDLVDTRGFKDELERMLAETEEKNSANVDGLQKKVVKLERTLTDYEEKLETKSEAINCLLAELARKSQELESIGEIEDVIHEIDDRMSERIDDSKPVDRERVTRLLIGRVDNQELRFPLFKDRLTIGRTKQNDIQLKAQYISRRHAVITTEGDAARVIDWGSKNGVYVNSKRVSEHFLENGDIVTIGVAEFRYEELPKRDL